VPVYRSPGSFNSQVGVPLSVWEIPPDAGVAIIEAGLSAPGEMARLESIIRPDVVVFTHLGDAHDEGFGGDQEAKLQEKLLLASRAGTIVFPEDEMRVAAVIRTAFADRRLVSWSLHQAGQVRARP